MIKNMRSGAPNLFKEGSRHFSGLETVVLKNIQACVDLASITRTSMGPTGMNKMVINYLQKLFITSDAATIIKEMEVVHPAAKMVVLAAGMQQKEIGDGSNFVVIFAGELCQMAEDMIHEGHHTRDIVTGYNMALKKSLEILDELVVRTEVDLKNVEVLSRGMRAAVSAKLYGYEDFLCELIAKACCTVMPKESFNFAVDNVRVCKVVGGQVYGSEMISGMVLDRMVEGNVHKVKDAKIALFVGSVDTSSTETKGTVLLKDAEQLLKYNIGEEQMMEKIIQQFADLGVNVVISGSNVSDMAMHFLEKHKILVLRVSSKFELRRVCRTIKCRPHVQFGPAEKEYLGHCSRVYVREIGATKVTVFEQSEMNSSVATVLVRGSTQNIVDDVERAVDDGVNIVKAMSKDARFLAGGGAVEIELSRRLQTFGSEESSIAQYSIKKFAEALEVIPRALAESSGMNQTAIVSDLFAAHNSDEKDCSHVGVDIEAGKIGNMVSKDILDLHIAKRTALKLATDAVTTIIRVDQMIMAKAAGGPKMGQKKGHWDQED